MHRFVAIALLFAVTACAPKATPPQAPRPASAATSIYSRVPDRIDKFALTQRAVVTGVPTDSIYRFSDGSVTRLTVFVYDVRESVLAEPDSQKWTAMEGSQFAAVQEIQRQRGQIAAFVVAFSDTARIEGGGVSILEHSVGVPVRYPNGNVAVELQYLYLISGKFVKVRATIPEPNWKESTVPAFARGLAITLGAPR